MESTRHSVKRRAVVVVAAAFACWGAGGTQVLAAPNVPIPEGPAGISGGGTGLPAGRVQDVEQDPFNPSHWLALSDASVWGSKDGGATWKQAYPGLALYGQWKFTGGSLAFDPAVQNVVLVASTADDRLPTGVGIYRSINGGGTWKPAAGGQPTCPAGSTPSPTQIVFSGHAAVAAGGCAAGFSSDDGKDWKWAPVSTSDPFGVSGVAVDSNSNVFACSDDGIYELSPGSGTFTRVVSFTTDPTWTLGKPAQSDLSGPTNENSCRIVAEPNQTEHVFFTANWQGLHLGGINFPASAVIEAYNAPKLGWRWQDLIGPSHNNGRDPVVSVRLVAKPGLFSLYWDSDDNDFFNPCQERTGSFDCTPGATRNESLPDPPWHHLQDGGAGGLHGDTSHFLFSPTSPYCLEAVSSDGGVERSPSCSGTGSGWTYTDRGISATEPYGLALTSIPELGTDLYLAVQDDGLFSLLAGTSGWTQPTGTTDGQGVEVTPFAHSNALSNVHVYYNGNAVQSYGPRGYTAAFANSAAPFSSPWFGISAVPLPSGMPAVDSPQLADIPTGQVALAVSKQTTPGSFVSATTGIFVSTDGLSWTGPIINLTGPVDLSIPGSTIYGAGTAANPVMFVNAWGNLYRVNGVTSPTSTRLLPADTVGAFAAADATHLLAFACVTSTTPCRGTVEASSNGGTTWRRLEVPERLATSDGLGGSYPLAPSQEAINAQIMSVAVDPVNPSVMTIGTRDTGLFESADAGASWERVPFLAPTIDNMRFDVPGQLWFSSFGRGGFRTSVQPDTLSLAARTATAPAQSWAATALTFTGAPIPGQKVEFSMIPKGGGAQTPVGNAVTDSTGTAVVTFTPPGPKGSYQIIAHIDGPTLNQELETQHADTVS